MQRELDLHLSRDRDPDLSVAQRAFYAEDGHSVCLACPGSGKTRTLIAKTLRLAEQHGLSQVMAITFTRAATEEMKTRLRRALGANANQIKVCTFHSLAYRHLVARKRINIASDADQRGILMRAIEREGLDISVEKAAEAMARFKRQIAQTPVPADHPDYDAYRVYQAAQEAMRSHGVMDLDDLMLQLLLGLQSSEIRPLSVKALLVDEFQDVDEIQLGVALEYARRGTKVHVVADDDQSIYGFRAGMGYHGLVALRQALDAKQFVLDTNFRCAPAIVDLAARVIGENRLRLPKLLRSGATWQGSPELKAFPSAFAEADAIVNDHVKRTAGDQVVLARVNQWLDAIELVAVSRDVPVHRVGGGSFFARHHVVQALAAVRLGLAPHDGLALMSTLHLTHASMEVQSQLELALTSLESGTTPLSLLYEAKRLAEMDKTDATAVRELRALIADWLGACGQTGATQGRDRGSAINEPLQQLLAGLAQYTRGDWRAQDIGTLSRLLVERVQGALHRRVTTVEGWMRRTRRKENDPSNAALRLMTIHGAKGLEFDSVWVAGVNEGILPYEGCDGEEERRLFYVAVTRAKRQLTVSYVLEKDRTPSQFVVASGLTAEKSAPK
jgi:superfamily I DNA/RNA helicase